MDVKNLVSPRLPSLLVLISPYLCQPLLAVVSFFQPFLLSWPFPATDSLWHPMPALGNLCQSLPHPPPPRGGGGGGALLDKASYHAIEKTANQNTEKLLYIRRYYTQSSHRALRSYSCRNYVSGDISSFKSCFSHVSAKFFPWH